MATKTLKKKVAEPEEKSTRFKKPVEISDEQQERITAISEKIRELRLKKGQDSESFAIANKIHRVTYFNAEKSTNITLVTLLKILDAHSMTLEQFFKGLK